jgi:hypothetical protein
MRSFTFAPFISGFPRSCLEAFQDNRIGVAYEIGVDSEVPVFDDQNAAVRAPAVIAGFQALAVPPFPRRPFSLPIPVVTPPGPVPLKPVVGDTFVIPVSAIPVVVSVESSPAWVNTIEENRNSIVILPSAVIIERTIPETIPQIPPPTIPKKEIFVDVRNNINMVCFGQQYNLGRTNKGDWRRQGNINAYIYPCRCLKRERGQGCQEQ